MRFASSGLLSLPLTTVTASQIAVVGNNRYTSEVASCCMICCALRWFSSSIYTKEIMASASTITRWLLFFPGIGIVVGAEVCYLSGDVFLFCPFNQIKDSFCTFRGSFVVSFESVCH